MWRLHEAWPSLDALKARFVLAHKGIPFSATRARDPDAEDRGWDLGPWLERADGGRVDGWVAIAACAEGLRPAPRLAGKGALGLASATMWRRRFDDHAGVALDGLLAIEADGGAPFRVAALHVWPPTEETRAQWRGAAERLPLLLELALTGRRFVSGDEPTLADVSAFCALEVAVALGVARPRRRDCRVRLWRHRLARTRGGCAIDAARWREATSDA